MRIQRRKQPAYIFTFLLLISLYPITVIAEQPHHHWSIENSLGLTYGHARELVYWAPGYPDLMSELVWPLEGLVFYGTKLSYSYGKTALAGFYGTLGLRFGFTMQSGTITDKDWLGYDSTSDSFFLTNFSAHKAISEHSQWIDANIGYGFQASDRFVIRTGLTASFMNLHWTARDGYTQYGSNTGSNTGNNTYISWSSSFPKEPVYGTGIGYWQYWVSLAPTFELFWQTTDRLTISGGTSLLILNACYDQDDHYLRLLQFTEHMTGGFGIEPKFTVSYRLASNLSIGIEGSWRYITGLRGDAAIMEIGSGATSSPIADSAGTDYSVGSCAVFVRFTPQR